MLLSILALLAQTVPVAQEVIPNAEVMGMTDAQICELAKETAAGMQQDLPLKADAITTTNGFGAACSAKLMFYNKFVDADLASLRDGWGERKREQFRNIMCENVVFLAMSKRGWQFANIVTFRSGERITHQVTC